MISHHLALFIAYAGGLVAWRLLALRLPSLWPAVPSPNFTKPWLEVAWAFLAVFAVLGIGTLYSQHRLLPATHHHRPALDAVNQVLIYSPFFVLLLVRRQGLSTAWLPTRRIPHRIAIGLAVALLALAIYSVTRIGLAAYPRLLGSVYAPRHISDLVQVLLEDIGIAILFVRMRAALGLRWTLLLVAILFAAAHIPGLLAAGAGPANLLALFADAGLGVLALIFLQRAQDVWWFWMLHFALDMTQFFQAPSVA